MIGGEAKPGFEPEAGAAQHYAIAVVRWFDLRNPTDWEAEIKKDSLMTFPQLQRIRAVLGYSAHGNMENNGTD